MQTDQILAVRAGGFSDFDLAGLSHRPALCAVGAGRGSTQLCPTRFPGEGAPHGPGPKQTVPLGAPKQIEPHSYC